MCPACGAPQCAGASSAPDATQRVQELCHAAQQGHGASELSGLIRDGLYGIGQISEIVVNLKNFSRLDRAKVSRFDLNEGIESTLVIAKNLVKMKTIRKDYSPDALITGSPSEPARWPIPAVTQQTRSNSSERDHLTNASMFEPVAFWNRIADRPTGLT